MAPKKRKFNLDKVGGVAQQIDISKLKFPSVKNLPAPELKPTQKPVAKKTKGKKTAELLPTEPVLRNVINFLRKHGYRMSQKYPSQSSNDSDSDDSGDQAQKPVAKKRRKVATKKIKIILFI